MKKHKLSTPCAAGLARLVSSLLVLGALFTQNAAMSQEPTDTQRWLEHAPAAPDFRVAATRRAFEKQRADVRATLWQLLGKLPPRPRVPKVKTLAREDRGTYWLERFEFDNGAGATVPGVLLLPKNISGKAPAILWNHWHGGQYDLGKAALMEAKYTPAASGPTLAARGYAVLAIDSYCFGERNGRGADGLKGGAGEMSASKFNLWFGRTLWGMIVRDDLMALDYLCSRPEVDAKRIGVTGISMGATRTWWLMALDDRPKAGVAVCCLTRYRDLIEAQGMHGHGIYYFVPGMLNHFDTEAVVACIAPRAFLSLAGGNDGGSPVPGIRKIEDAAAPAWRLFDKAGDFRSVIYPGVAHVYTPEMWQEMLGWFDSRLAADVPAKQKK
jgi:dienelactone hydrolase